MSVVNVCPSGTATVASERVWQVLAAPERYGEWVDAEVLEVSPPGPAQPGQRIRLSAPAFGLRFKVFIDVEGLDPERRWIALRVHLPFGVVNAERVTLTEVAADRTLVRFN